MQIRKANLGEEDDIFQIYIEAIQHMKQNGIFQWDDQYPNRPLLVSDIEDEEVYVVEDEGKFLAAIVLNEYQDEEYREIHWVEPEGRALIVHRLAVRPRVQGKGLAKELLRFAETYARERGYTQIRLDTYSANPNAVKLYETLGYQHRGQVMFTREFPFYCMQKLLK